MATKQLSTKQVVNLPADPATGTKGEIYFNTVSNTYRYYNGTAWTDFSGGNSFQTIDVPNGTDPVADSSTDTLILSQSNGVVITGDSATDTITISTNATSLNTASTIISRDADQSFDITAIDFDTADTIATAAGRLHWDSAEGTLQFGMPDGVVQSIGMEFYMPPTKNDSGVIIPNGAFVMATGTQGDRITIAKAVTNGTVDPMYMIGVATEEISIGSENGIITVNGTVRDIDTSAWAVGTILYPNPSVAGGLTSIKPDAPNIRTPIAIVLRQHANTGRIYVRMTNGSILGGTDSNVKFTSLADNNIISYNGTSSIWENQALVDAIKEVDGAASGIDADLLDGQHGSYYLDWTNTTNKPDPTITLTGDVTGTGTMTDLGNVSFATTIAANSVALGTDTTGNYVASVSGTDGVTISGTGEGAAVTIANSDKGSSQNIFKNITDGTNTASAETNNDTFTLTAGTGIGIVVNASTDTATFTNSGVTSLTGTANEIDVSASTGGVTLSLPATINANTTGNAATVTNGVYTTGSYADPTWITSLAWSKISGEPTTLAGYGITDAIDTSATAQTKSGDLTISGNLTVQGTTTFLDTTNLQVEDKNIELGKVTTPSNSTADGGGITLLDGGTNKTFNWINATSSWTSSEHIDLASGKVLKIAGTEVLSATQYTGNAATATKWATARTLTIGSTGKSVDGSANVSWSLTEIGAQPVDADLTAIAAITTTGILKRTGADTWTTITDNSTNWDSAYTQRLQWDGGSTNLVAATGRTSLGATTVGSNFFTLTNPSAITFPKINADNTVTAESAATHRTSIGATTVGSNLFTLTNPSAITFLRVNADNTVSALDAATFRTAIGAGTSSTTGTVTSVGMTVPTGLSVTPASITTSGTFAVSLTAGYEIPQSSAIVHIAGTETITGEKQFSASGDTSGGARIGTANNDSEVKLAGTGTNHWALRNNDGILRIGTANASVNLGTALTSVMDLTTTTVNVTGTLTASTSIGITSGPTWTNDNGKFQTTSSVRIDAAGALYLVNNSAAISFGGSSDVAITRSAENTLTVNGTFTATTKSFDIQHPTKENMRLRYGSLEGPENGVYVRGKSRSSIITLPDYWTGLVDEDSITVQLTPYSKRQRLYVKNISDNTVEIGGVKGEFYYFIQAERKDVDKLVVEY